jgi:hypothetical protein
MDEKEKAQARLDAIEVGRLAGKLEAASRREENEEAAERVKRAMAYAAWDFDGRLNDDSHLVEFGLGPSKGTPSLERPSPQTGAAYKEDPDNGKTPKRRFGR